MKHRLSIKFLLLSFLLTFSLLNNTEAQRQNGKRKNYLVRVALTLKNAQDSLAEITDMFEPVVIKDISDRKELIRQMQRKVALYHRACGFWVPAIYLTDSSLNGLSHLPMEVRQRDSIQYTIKYHQINLGIYRAQLALEPMYDSMLLVLEQESKFPTGSDSSKFYSQLVVSIIERYANYRNDVKKGGEAMLELTGSRNEEELNTLDNQNQQIEGKEKGKAKRSKH